ncbi:uncharacterized protein LOC100181987 isoform X2 [Ciona intestinalis]
MNGNYEETDARSPDEIGQIIDQLTTNFVGDADKTSFSDSTNACMNQLRELSKLTGNTKRRSMGEALCNSGAGETLMKYFKMASTSNCIQECQRKEFKTLREICFNFTDDNMRLAEEFGREGLIGMLVGELNEHKATFNTNQKQKYIVSSALRILYNCSKSSDNLVYYKEAGALETVGWYATTTMHDKNLKDIFTFSVMTLAFIVDGVDDEIVTKYSIVTTSVQMFVTSVASENGRHLGFSSLELVDALIKLADNVTISEMIVDEGVVTPLIKMMTSGDRELETAATSLIWSLSFSDRNKDVFKKNLALMRRIEDFQNPNLQKTAQGVSAVLNMKRKATIASDAIKIHDVTPESDKEGHIMISYNWKYKSIAVNLRDRLVQEGYKTWFDDDNMGSDILQSMSEGVEGAHVFLMLASQSYKESKNCKTEAEGAYRCNVPIIPLVVEGGYTANGWLGLLFGMKRYHKFHNDADFDTSFVTLLKDVKSKVPKKE